MLAQPTRKNDTFVVFQMKNLLYFRFYLIKYFLCQNIFTEFPVLKEHDDNVTQ